MHDYPTFPDYDPATTVLLFPSDDARLFQVMEHHCNNSATSL
jgi:hypothetical protein